MRRGLVILSLAAVLAVLGGSATSKSQGLAPIPELTFACSPPPTDCTGWYRSNVTLTWDWNQHVASESGGDCRTAIFTSDTKETRRTCQITAGDSTASRTATIRIDKTPPLVSATSTRSFDYEGWFNHPVGFSFEGTDQTSGIASCSSANYAGPNTSSASVGGSCSDVAGNVGFANFPLKYDSTAPAPPRVAARPGNRLVSLDWANPASEEVVEVTRFRSGAWPAMVFRGRAGGFVDRGLRNQARYGYTVALRDQAGNRAESHVNVVPTASRLLLPARNARVTAPPRLVWKDVKRAKYFNVQLRRGGRKVLSRWPRSASLQLLPRWRFLGRRRSLSPGRYTWYVWPGYGRRSAQRYGKLLGKSSFTVVR